MPQRRLSVRHHRPRCIGGHNGSNGDGGKSFRSPGISIQTGYQRQPALFRNTPTADGSFTPTAAWELMSLHPIWSRQRQIMVICRFAFLVPRPNTSLDQIKEDLRLMPQLSPAGASNCDHNGPTNNAKVKTAQPSPYPPDHQTIWLPL